MKKIGIPNPARLNRTNPARGRSFVPIQVSLLVVDVLLIQLSLVGAFWIRIYSPFLGIPREHELGLDHAWALGVISTILVYIYHSNGLYRAVQFRRPLQQSTAILKAVTQAMAFLLLVTFMTKSQAFSERRSILAISWVLLTSSEIFFRCVVFPPIVRRALAPRRVLVVGTGDGARQLLGRFNTQGHRAGLSILGLVDGGTSAPAPESIEHIPIVGELTDLEELIASHRVDDIFVADLALGPERTLAIITRCKQLGVGIRVVSGLFEPILPRIETETLGTIPLVRLRRRPFHRASLLAKRAVDIVGAGLGLLVISPLFLLIALLVKSTSKGPFFFVQKRVGRDARPFDFLKFRTMTVDNDDAAHREFVQRYIGGEDVAQSCDRTADAVNKIVNDARVTTVGRFLRRFSLDELPQLLNVLRGDMSLVGPRPPLTYEVEVYKNWHRRRLEAMPGLTGLWQVSGRNRLSFEQMVLLDLYYIENWSLTLDLKILLQTLPVVLFEKATY